MKLTYNEFDVQVIEDIKEFLSQDEVLKNYIRLEDIYLFDIPEESKKEGLIVRLNYINIGEEVFFGDYSNGDEFVIQVDVWDEKRPPISLSNRIRKVLGEYGFKMMPGTFDNIKEMGKHRDSRRYIAILIKEGI